MADLEALLTKENILRSRLDKLIDNGRKTAIVKRTQGFYEAKINDLKHLWDEYCAIDLAINEILLQSEEVKHKYLEEDRYGVAEFKYSEYMGELVEGLRKFAMPATQNATNIPPMHQTTVVQQESLLPRITIPKYNGDYELWRSFHDLFISIVHNNAKLSPVQKLYHLKSCLTGDAEKLLRHTPITDQDYEPAWNKLKTRYENKRILVNHQLKILVSQPKITLEKAKNIKAILDTTEECLQQLNSLKIDTTSWDVLLIHLLVQKLPFQTLKLWEEEQGASQDIPQYSDFKAFLDKRLNILESIADAVTSSSTVSKPSTRETTLTHHITKTNKCPACEGKHFIQGCNKYRGMNIEARLKVIKASGRCINCLSQNHFVKDCTSNYKCNKCNLRHHTTLHQEIQPTSTNNVFHTKQGTKESKEVQQQHGNNSENSASCLQPQTADTADELNTTAVFVTRDDHQALLSTALVFAHSRLGKPVILRCLIDSGSQSSFITEEACKRVQAMRSHTATAVTGLNTCPAAFASQKTILQLRSCGSDNTELEEEFLIVKTITETLPNRRISRAECKHLNGLTLADPTYWKPGKIDALLGVQLYAKILQDGIRRGIKTAPVAVNTRFGWILMGSTRKQKTNNVKAFTVTTVDCELDKQLKRFWEIEEVPTKTILSQQEEKCQEFYQDTVQRLSTGKYQVKLPFVDTENPTLGLSRPQALKRFLHLQRQFAAKPDLERDYRQCLNEYIQLGHMQPINSPKEGEEHYYIPHHAVFKESSTTKLRVVFDASAKSTNGNSLNDLLMKGPTLQPKLFATLLNWRKYKVALNADIEKMYRMIEVHPDHRTFQRIIWQHPDTREIQDYQLNTVTFGTSAAPYLAIRTLQKLAEDEKINWPNASNIVQKEFYVDDVLTGADTITEAKALQAELITMLKSGGFNLRKWTSNNVQLIEELPADFKDSKSELLFAEKGSIKTLGVRWHPSSDHFGFSITFQGEQYPSTKRTILSSIASLYDPLGWLAPIIITAKIFMQNLWITGSSWDTPVREIMQEQWNRFKSDLLNLEQLQIPRWINYSKGATIQVHGFCDASEKAYAAAVYIRITSDDGVVSSNLLTAKTRVAPAKPITIPRLELNGAVLLTRLIKSTIADMHLENATIYAWTDSTIVLQWIDEHPSRWKTYVANRVVEIQETLRSENWKHVRTDCNPADLASRGISVPNLIDSRLWWHGPDWLVKNQKDWPVLQLICERTRCEVKVPKIKSFFTELQSNILENYSSFIRLVRVIATLKRFMHNCKNPTEKLINSLSCAELTTSENIVFKLVQKSTFPDEYASLVSQQQLHRRSKILKLNPFMDNHGLIRLGGRLENAAIPFARKHPIILPKDHHVTHILIDKLHKESLHGGTALVLNISRDKYWILDARRCITSRIHKCITCARHRKVSITQVMGNLPTSRVNMEKPFCKVGIDYAGPVTIKLSSLRNAKTQKAYFCIFVCMVTKAIHIEVVSDSTSAAFIAALKRFVARRGLCSDIYSDCGTNFVGGNAFIQKDFNQATNEQVLQYITSRSINWHFNPPAAPHFGGLWEAGVKSVKHHLRRVLGNIICTFEEYSTVLTQIEACLNSRPLCYISNNSEELFALTPGHFLIGQALMAIPEPDYSNKKILPSQRWKHLQSITRQFWDRWSKDYLNQLQNRPKWQCKEANVQKGEIVILKYENMPPTIWPLGIVEEIFPGKDGFVRVVKIRTKHGSFQRPVSKICRLPLDEEY